MTTATVKHLNYKVDRFIIHNDHKTGASHGQHLVLNIFVECLGSKFARTLVGPSQHVKPHEQVAKVVFEKSMMDVMVRGRSKAQSMKEAIPRKGVLGMNQRQPVCVGTAKGHVGPDIAMHEIGGGVEWNEDHADCIENRSIKGIKESGVCELVMRLVRPPVKGRRYIVLQPMHHILNTILNYQTSKNFGPFNPTFKLIIRFWHETKHPCPRQITSQQQKSLRLR